MTTAGVAPRRQRIFKAAGLGFDMARGSAALHRIQTQPTDKTDRVVLRQATKQLLLAIKLMRAYLSFSQVDRAGAPDNWRLIGVEWLALVPKYLTEEEGLSYEQAIARIGCVTNLLLDLQAGKPAPDAELIAARELLSQLANYALRWA